MKTQSRINQHLRTAGALLVAVALSGTAGCGGDTGAGSVDNSLPAGTDTPPATSPAPATSPPAKERGRAGGKVVCARPPKSAPSSGGRSVGSADAGRIVIGTYGGRVIGVEPDEDLGRAAWEVEAAGGPCGRIEVDVDQETGRIVTFETED